MDIGVCERCLSCRECPFYSECPIPEHTEEEEE